MKQHFLSIFPRSVFNYLPARVRETSVALLFAILSIHSVNAVASDLFISEYVEGSSLNKVIEIYNPTGVSVDLSAGVYTLELYSNGSPSPSATMPLSGVIADGDVIVLAHGSASAAVLALADETNNSVINFNGDDAIVLRKNGVIIDAFGQVGVDPGAEWPGGGQNDTLRRKDSVCAGDTNASDAFDASVEWNVFAIDTFDDLGSHAAECAEAPVELVINEILQNPSAVSDGSGEWFELYNPGSSPVDIEGWTISDNGTNSHVISSGGPVLVPAGGYLVLGNNPDSGTNGGVTVDYSYGNFFLGNSDDEVILTDATQTEIDRVEYDGGPGFPDPTGASMALINPELDNNVAENWCESTTPFGAGDMGTPGAANDCPGGGGESSDLVINEILQNPSAVFDSNGEWFELYNPGSSPVDIDGWTISDNGSNSHLISNGGPLLVPAGGYLVLGNNSDPGTNGGVTVDYSYDNFFLGNGDDEVILTDATQTEIDRVEYDGGPGFPDPTGASMALINPALDNNVAGNWCESTTAFGAGDMGTPGAANDCPGGAAGELLLSEAVVTPTTGEFLEIHNPGAFPVDLSDVYLSDATFAGGGTYYYNLVTGANAGGGGFSDFHARFPDGASIEPGEYQTISLTGSINFHTEYGVEPTYELYEDGAAPDGVPDMREAFPGSINGQGGLTNSGEFAVLYHWDGQSDLVTDLDYIVWGDKAEAVDKTGVSIDGPDADAIASTYQADTAIAAQDVLDTGAHAFGFSWQREDLTEGTETGAGGNGINGEDETSENLSVTWCAAPPTPNAGTDCTLPPPLVLIHDIQGSGLASSMVGSVVAIEGIVVGDFQDGVGANGDINGFHVQEEDGDADADGATSEGIFVYDGTTPAVDVSVGDLVRVEGTVAEWNGLTELTSVTLVSVISSGNSLPAATEVTLPVTSIDDFEKYEGMYVTLPQTLFIAETYNYARYNEVGLASVRRNNATAEYEPGPDAIQAGADYLLDRIALDDGRSAQNPDPARHPDGATFDLSNLFRAGDTLAGVTGVMDFASGQYRIQPTQGAIHTEANPRPAKPDDVGGSLKVASFNVLTYFTTLDEDGNTCGPQNWSCWGADNAEEFTRQRDKIISALLGLDADIVGLVEIENHAGDVPTADLVSGLNAIAGAGTWDYIPTGAFGTSVLRQALIYKPAKVTPDGVFAILDSSVDPTFDDQNNRPVLAQTFRDNATTGRVTIAVNHFRSKGSDCNDEGDPDTGDGSGNCNLTRENAAKALVSWLATDPTGSGDDDFLILGDLNAYDREAPIDALVAGGYTDLVDAFVGNSAYSFLFSGTGYLDYALAGANLLGEVTGTTVWNINADEPNLIDYNMDFKQDAQDAIYAPDAYRSSDHDPVLLGLDLVPVANLSITKEDNTDTVIPGEQVTYEIVVSNAGPDSEPAAVVTDTFADSLTCTYTSVAAGGAAGNTAAGSGDLADTLAMPAGSKVTYTAVCTIDPATHNGVLANVAEVSGSAFDPDVNNNRKEQTANLVRHSDILISEIASKDVVVAGTELSYTIAVTNDGPSNAENIVITDQLPPFTTFVSATPSAGGSCTSPAQYSIGTVICGWAGDTAPGGQHSLELVVRVDASAPNGSIIDESATSGSDSQNPDAKVNSTSVQTTVVTEAYWNVTMFWTDGGDDSMNITLTCDGIAPVSSVANPEVLTTLTATGWVNGSTSCVLAQDHVTGVSVEYSVDCAVDNAVSNTTYVCEIYNTDFVGIPTLNQTGLAILVLLMLSVGLVGFRRFS